MKAAEQSSVRSSSRSAIAQPKAALDDLLDTLEERRVDL